MENRIEELKSDLGADGFCLKHLLLRKAFGTILLLINLPASSARRQAASLSAAGDLSCTGADLRHHSQPRWSPDCASLVEKMGWSGWPHALGGEYLELAKPQLCRSWNLS
jgi:hypothetical protein